MTTNETTETTIESNEEVEGDDPSQGMAPKPLRKAYNKTVAENAQLKAQLMERAYTEAGLDTTSGLGKAIAKEYKGDPTTEGLLEYAKDEYDWEPKAAPDNPDAPVIATEQAKLDQAQTVSGSQVPLNESDALRQASADGDLQTAGAIKAAQLRRKFE